MRLRLHRNVVSLALLLGSTHIVLVPNVSAAAITTFSYRETRFAFEWTILWNRAEFPDFPGTETIGQGSFWRNTFTISLRDEIGVDNFDLEYRGTHLQGPHEIDREAAEAMLRMATRAPSLFQPGVDFAYTETQSEPLVYREDLVWSPVFALSELVAPGGNENNPAVHKTTPLAIDHEDSFFVRYVRLTTEGAILQPGDVRFDIRGRHVGNAGNDPRDMASVPEASTFLLLGTGLAAAAVRRVRAIRPAARR